MKAEIRGSRLREFVAAALAYGLASVALLYPIFVRGAAEIYSPALTLARPIAKWVMWILSWDVHALTSGTSLFEANVFHPAPHALAYADPLFGLLPLFAPAYLVTGDPVVSYQWTLLVTVALCGASMFCLARQWGVGLWAAAVAGLVYAYCPARIALLGELAHFSEQYLPLALLFVERFAERRRLSDLVAAAAFAAWQAVCGTQIAFTSIVVLALYGAVGALVRRPGLRMPVLGAALVSTMAAIGAMVAVTGPYRAVMSAGYYSGGSMRELAGSATADAWRMYFVPPYLGELSYDGSLYIGLSVLALALVGFVKLVRLHPRLVIQLSAIVLWCYWMTLGLGVAGGDLALYRLALDWIPGFEALGPPPARFATLLMLPVAGLAAFGVEGLRQVAAARWIGTVLAVVAAGVVLADYRLPSTRFDTQRVLYGAEELPVYAALADLPDGPVLEMPMRACAVRELGTVIDRQLASTIHWKPLLDGYRSQWRAPVTHDVVRGMANALPDPRALVLLRRATGVRYVVVHLADLPGDWRHRWRAVEGTTRIGFFGHDLLLDLGDEIAPDLLGELERAVLPGARRTLTGVELAKLEGEARSAGLGFSRLPPRTARVGAQIRAELLVENRSSTIWPALTADLDHRVYVSYLWADAEGGLAGGSPRAQALPFDLAPGESVVVPICVGVPNQTGDLALSFGITQNDEWFDAFTERIRVSVVRPRTEFWTPAAE